MIRYATRDDLVSWMGEVPGTMRAVVAERDGKLVAIAGVMNGVDHCQAFSAYKPEATKLDKGRLAVFFRSILDQYASVVAFCSQTEPTAPGLLASLGFEHIDGNTWRRHATRIGTR